VQQLLLKTTTMNRKLQHASIALEKDDDPMALLFPYCISVIVCLVCVWFAFRFAYSWVRRVCFGYEEPIEPLSGEEILANLSDDQRRAVMQAIISKVCKVRYDRQAAPLYCCAFGSLHAAPYQVLLILTLTVPCLRFFSFFTDSHFF
jgi:hypothetical protein